jgi:DNA modification methylase
MLLLNGDCIEEMQKMIDEGVQVDSVVTDPPYELGFMGKSWDSTGIAFLVVEHITEWQLR